MQDEAEDCAECRELEKRINQRIKTKEEATQQFSSAMQSDEPPTSRQQLAAKAYDAEIELRVLYEVQLIHELLHSDPNGWLSR